LLSPGYPVISPSPASVEVNIYNGLEPVIQRTIPVADEQRRGIVRASELLVLQGTIFEV
jgi:hypothetical protein